MKKILGSTLVITLLVWIGWQYAPQKTREALLGFIGLASRRAQGQDVPAAEIRRALADTVLSESPAARREILTKELRRNINDLRRRAAGEEQNTNAAIAAGFSSGDTRASTTATDVLADTERIIKELEDTNQDGGAGARLIERVIERILPSAQCKNE